MSYKLEFNTQAYKEWKKLDENIKSQFKKKLQERLLSPRVESAKVHGMPDCYKIKLRAVGYRLIYQVKDQVLTVFVLAVNKRDKLLAYDLAKQRSK